MNDKVYAEELNNRIQDYNLDFSKTLKNTALKHLACEFTYFKDEINTWYSSDTKEIDGIKQLFQHLKHDFDKDIKHITWNKKQKVWVDIHQNKLSIHKDELLENILEKRYDNNILVIYYNVNLNINQNSKIDLRILCLFEFKLYHYIDVDELNRFIKYPTDFFTSPVMTGILNDFDRYKEKKINEGEQEARHKIQAAEQEARRKIQVAEQEVARLKSEIAATCHVMYRTIENSHANFHAIDKIKVSQKVKTRIENIRKRHEYVRISMKLLNNSNPNETLTDFQSKTTLEEMLKMVWDMYVPLKCTLQLAYETESLKQIPFKNHKNEFFLVLWNVLHNADFHTDETAVKPIVTCRVYESENACCIDITNQTTSWHLDKLRHHFENQEQATLDGMGSKGLATLFIKCKKMNWIPDYRSENKKATISLKTNLNIKQND